MSVQTILLIVAAVVPALGLCLYIFLRDRVEKEPIGLLLLLLACGVVICFPAAQIEEWLGSLITTMFIPVGEIGPNGELLLEGFYYYCYHFMQWFIGVALVEEGLKYAALLLVTRNNKHFNCLFDGIVYSVFVSLGFAGFENVLYSLNYGWSTALMRAVTAVPAHMFFSVLMGLYYSWWKVYQTADRYEARYRLAARKNAGSDRIKPWKYLVLSLAVPTAVHGLYDFCCSVGTTWAVILFYALLLFLYAFCFLKVRQMSRRDGNIEDVAIEEFRKLYPEAVVDAAGQVIIDEHPIIPPRNVPAETEIPPTGPAHVYTFPCGDKYVGGLLDGKLSGYGVYYFVSGGKYEGVFREGMFCGYGVYTDPTGGRYEGEWANNQRHGRGVYYWKNGKSVAGVWENGKLTQPTA